MIQETQKIFGPEIREVLELLDFASSVALALLGFAVVFQLRYAKQSLKDAQANLKIASDSLRTAKDDLQIRVDREATILAAEQADKFGRELEPKAAASIRMLTQKGIDIPEWELKNRDFNFTSLLNQEAANDWLRSVHAQEIRGKLIQVLNEFESFSIYFAKGAANEQVVYPSLAPVFCSYVRQLLPLLLSLRQKESAIVSGAYQNTITLYDRWACRLEKERLDREAAKIAGAASGLPVTPLPVVGLQGNSKPN